WDHRVDKSGAVSVGKRMTFKSSILDLKTGKVAAGDELLKPVPETKARVPILGGKVTVDIVHQGKRYLGGEHGLLIMDDPNMRLDGTWPTAVVKDVPTRKQRWRAEAQERKVIVRSPEDLATLLGEENPFLREKAMQELRETPGPAYVPVLAKAVRDEYAP